MDKKRLLELAGVQLNEAAFFDSPEDVIKALMHEFDFMANVDPKFDFDQQAILRDIIRRYEKEPIVRRALIGGKRQRGRQRER